MTEDKKGEWQGIREPGPEDFDQYPDGRYVDPKNDDPADVIAQRTVTPPVESRP